nr:11-beta-hydroxysteroid dehydrogenase 1B-like [Tanacetum cinerariifolium]
MLINIDTEDVAGKVVLIVGASSGIGEHVAYEYAKRGACLVLAARRKHSLREVAGTAVSLGAPDAIAIRADVSNIEDLQSSQQWHLFSSAGELSSLAVGTSSGSGNLSLAVGMPCAFYSQQSSHKLDAPSAIKFPE